MNSACGGGLPSEERSPDDEAGRGMRAVAWRGHQAEQHASRRWGKVHDVMCSTFTEGILH
ncbi:hypothetical protein [Mycobacterium lepromatosis]|nr:hypothetical protein [Mycobacterium lepromatosis]